MNQKAITLIITLTLFLFSCNSSTNKQENVKTESKSIVDEKRIANENELTENTNKEEIENDCARGIAEPIIQKEDYPNTTFALQPDDLTGIETVNFDNGDKLIIKNWGCENYVLTFRFETIRFNGDKDDLEFWYRSSSKLITGMIGGIDSPIEIKKGIMYLDYYINRDEKNNYKNLKLGEEIDFGGEEIREFLTVDKIEKLTENKCAVEITFTIGPL